MRLRESLVIGALTLVSGCGSGVPELPSPDQDLVLGEMAISPYMTLDTDQAQAAINGSAFVTLGAACSLYVSQADPQDPWSPATSFGCSCTDSGTGAVTWSNVTNGDSGYGSYSLSSTDLSSTGVCAPIASSWVTLVPVAPGLNVIRITMQDGQTIGTVEVTITRN